MSLKENLEVIRENIANAAYKSGRNYEDITLVAVTKTVNIETINSSIDLGVGHIGENKVQEIQKKHDFIKGNVALHMIGHLQSNKVKHIIDKVHLIHSLDRMSLAKELQRRAKESNINVNVLIQVNISEEESKFGLKQDKAIHFIDSIQKLDNIKVKGLMTMAPFVSDPNEARYVFKGLKDLSERITNRKFENVDMKHLSMGMTNDYEIAIEEGSNMVRIGSGIFGKRNY